MSILTGKPATRSWFFSDIQTGSLFWLSNDLSKPATCRAYFHDLNADGKSRDFDCTNGAWSGTLTEQDEGVLEVLVHATGSVNRVHITEQVEMVQS